MSSGFALHKGSQHITDGVVTDAVITSSSITMDEALDMGTNRVVNVADPVDAGDAVNLGYLTDHVVITAQVSLTGSAWTSIGTALTFGSVMVAVTPVVFGGASSVIVLSKNDASKVAHVVNTSRMRGIATGEWIRARWLASSDIEIRKTGSAHDGVYAVKII